MLGSSADPRSTHPSAEELSILDSRLAHFHELSRTQPPPPLHTRLARLDAIENLLRNNQNAIVTALEQDFACRGEAWSLALDVLGSLGSVKDMRALLTQKKFMDLQPVNSSYDVFPHNLTGASGVVSKPLGTIAILTPWNGPWRISMEGLASVLAAGNLAVLKPSELSPKTAELMRKLFHADLVLGECVHVCLGDGSIAAALTASPKIDHIFFTGSTAVGKQVMTAAAGNLTSCTMELGGKNTVFVCADKGAKSDKVRHTFFTHLGPIFTHDLCMCPRPTV